MAGYGRMLVGLGHDIQIISELDIVDYLKIPGIFFTEAECLYFSHRKNYLYSMAGIFSAKEAFFKSLPNAINFYWTDLEVLHDFRHAPYFKFYGSLEEYVTHPNWNVRLSISHSGDYVSTVVIISAH